MTRIEIELYADRLSHHAERTLQRQAGAHNRSFIEQPTDKRHAVRNPARR